MRRSLPARTTALLVLTVLCLTVASCSSGDDGSATTAGAKADSASSGVSRYVAIGDSYTSAPLVPVTDVADGCFRSSGNYPAMVAEELGAKVDDRSCGGADTSDYSRSQRPGVPPQNTALTKDTDLVTIGLGGNNGNLFSTLVGRCVALRAQDPDGAPCRTAVESAGKDVLGATLKRTRQQLVTVIEDVRRRAPSAEVLVVGYPQLVEAGSACAQLPFAADDYEFGEEVNRAMTQAVESAAEATDSTYIDVWSASQGHDICSDDPWVNGAVTDQKRAARYHPYAEEQRAVAHLVLDQVSH